MHSYNKPFLIHISNVFAHFTHQPQSMSQINQIFAHHKKRNFYYCPLLRGRRDSDRMVVGFTTTCAIRAYHH
jgi:hypothetical protein